RWARGFGWAAPQPRRSDRLESRGAAGPVTLEIARQRAQRRQRAHQRAALDAIGAAARQEGAQIRGGQPDEIGDCRRRVEAFVEKAEELPDVPAIAVERMRREP